LFALPEVETHWSHIFFIAQITLINIKDDKVNSASIPHDFCEKDWNHYL
jgi:hypothetical protein